MAETFVPLVRSASPAKIGAMGPALIRILRDVETKLAVPGAVPAAKPIGAATTGAEATHPQGEPKVTLIKEGETVTGIQVQCSCGQVIDLACVY